MVSVATNEPTSARYVAATKGQHARILSSDFSLPINSSCLNGGGEKSRDLLRLRESVEKGERLLRPFSLVLKSDCNGILQSAGSEGTCGVLLFLGGGSGQTAFSVQGK